MNLAPDRHITQRSHKSEKLEKCFHCRSLASLSIEDLMSAVMLSFDFALLKAQSFPKNSFSAKIWSHSDSEWYSTSFFSSTIFRTQTESIDHLLVPWEQILSKFIQIISLWKDKKKEYFLSKVWFVYDVTALKRYILFVFIENIN